MRILSALLLSALPAAANVKTVPKRVAGAPMVTSYAAARISDLSKMTPLAAAQSVHRFRGMETPGLPEMAAVTNLNIAVGGVRTALAGPVALEPGQAAYDVLEQAIGTDNMEKLAAERKRLDAAAETDEEVRAALSKARGSAIQDALRILSNLVIFDGRTEHENQKNVEVIPADVAARATALAAARETVPEIPLADEKTAAMAAERLAELASRDDKALLKGAFFARGQTRELQDANAAIRLAMGFPQVARTSAGRILLVSRIGVDNVEKLEALLARVESAIAAEGAAELKALALRFSSSALLEAEDVVEGRGENDDMDPELAAFAIAAQQAGASPVSSQWVKK